MASYIVNDDYEVYFDVEGYKSDKGNTQAKFSYEEGGEVIFTAPPEVLNFINNFEDIENCDGWLTKELIMVFLAIYEYVIIIPRNENDEVCHTHHEDDEDDTTFLALQHLCDLVEDKEGLYYTEVEE
jgi:hypothetical protein